MPHALRRTKGRVGDTPPHSPSPMKPGTRITILVIAIASAAAVWAHWIREAPEPHGNMRGQKRYPRYEDSRACQKCHTEVHAEWSRSAHAKGVESLADASTDWGDWGRLAPRPLLGTGLPRPPIVRRAHFGHGIDCLACHVNEDQRVVAKTTRIDVPCQPIADARLSSARLCASCHDEAERVLGGSPTGADVDASCVTCHLGAGGDQSSHSLAADAQLLERSLRLELERLDQSKARARLSARAALHRIELTGTRRAELWWRSGEAEWRRAQSLDAIAEAKAFSTVLPAKAGVGLQVELRYWPRHADKPITLRKELAK